MDAKAPKNPDLPKPASAPNKQASTQINKMLATMILQHMHLENIQLLHMNATRQPAFDKFSDDGNFQIQPKESIQTSYHKENRSVTAILTVGIIATHETDSLFEIVAIYRVMYTVKPSFTGENEEACAKAFCKTMALAHVWPYWRESLASICLKMDLPPILAPLRVVGATPTRKV